MNNSAKISSVFILSGIVLTFILFAFRAEAATTGAKVQAGPVKPLDYGIIAGEWQRTDGNYSIKISEVTRQGQMKVAYFNPNPINVEDPLVSTQGGLIKLFFKLDDKNYQGSTYKIYYFKEKDALVGFYHHGALDKNFEVIFLRTRDQ